MSIPGASDENDSEEMLDRIVGKGELEETTVAGGLAVRVENEVNKVNESDTAVVGLVSAT